MDSTTTTGLPRTKSDQLLEIMARKSPSRGLSSEVIAEAAETASSLSRKSSFGKRMTAASPGRSGGGGGGGGGGRTHIRKSRSAQLKLDLDEVSSGAALSRASSASLGLSFSFTGFTVPPEDIADLRGFSDIDDEIPEDIEAGASTRKKVTMEHTLPIYLKFTDVTYKVILKSVRTTVEKDILNGITGSASPGEVLALMGPSGSGKTTLLNLLGGRLNESAPGGSITYNEKPYSKSLKRRIGFVTQDDVLFPHLTVKETLTYAALLRLPKMLTKQQKEERAMDVIYELGLERCQDTMIGGSFVRGVSGGERKRVCIGNEIIINPSLLFLDEPTSGLDSTTALRIVQMLHDIAEYLVEAYETRVAEEKKKLTVSISIDEELKSKVSSPRREWGASWWQQYSILFWRGLKERRHDYLSWLRITQVLATATILGLLWWRSDSKTMKGMQDQAGLLFFIAVFWGFFPVFTAIFTFPQERAMLSKERAVDMYRLSAYFIARTTSDLPLDLFLPILFLLVVYFMAGLRLSVGPFFLSMLTVFLCIVAAQGLGLAIGATLMDVKRATTLASVTVMTFMLAGGFFVKRVPVFISWIRYISFNYHTYRLLLKVQYEHITPVVNGMKLDNGLWEVGALVTMVFGYRLLAYLSLRRMKLQYGA
ncbi:PREDICTED: ABC transporter G family member 22 isoform X2 [Nelumbo nucifera]|uniref:ABC transporter G family member 22 isoform X2 n=1 Tax=Nelumbo nucifera TaxID=4432 RepID=A0A1U7Z6T2_NELNU|nr:PREDICTED: ABC transporter G family member 22 isoform X2 [Nelumbo nucifera]